MLNTPNSGWTQNLSANSIRAYSKTLHAINVAFKKLEGRMLLVIANGLILME